MGEQRFQGQGGVTQPAVAVVPVADPAELLRQRRGRRGDDAAGVLVAQRPEGEQGAADRTGVAAVVLAPRRPVPPPRLGPVQGGGDVDGLRRRSVRGVPGEDEVVPGPGGDVELPDVAVVDRDGERVAAQQERVGACDREQRLGPSAGRGRRRGVGTGPDPSNPFRTRRGQRERGVDRGAVVLDPTHPRHVAAVPEADHQLLPHPDDALDALDPTDQVGTTAPDGHRLDHPHRPGRGPPHGLQGERVVPVTPLLDDGPGVHGGEQPPTVARVAQQGGEAGGGVEAGEAEPVDAAPVGHERGGVQVAQQGVAPDGDRRSGGHGRTLPPDRPPAAGRARGRFAVGGTARAGRVAGGPGGRWCRSADLRWGSGRPSGSPWST